MQLHDDKNGTREWKRRAHLQHRSDSITTLPSLLIIPDPSQLDSHTQNISSKDANAVGVIEIGNPKKQRYEEEFSNSHTLSEYELSLPRKKKLTTIKIIIKVLKIVIKVFKNEKKLLPVVAIGPIVNGFNDYFRHQ